MASRLVECPAPASARLGAALPGCGPWLLRSQPDWWLAAMVAGCALKTPPDAAAIKEQALPALQTPAQWTAKGAAAGACPTTGSRRSATISWRRRSPRPSRTTPTCASVPRASSRRMLHAKLAGAKLYPSVDLLAHGGGKMGDGSGLSGVALNANWELDLWGRVRYGRAASAAQAGSAQADFEYARQSIAALVAKSWFLATEAGLQVEAARESIRANEELVRLAGDRVRIGVGGQEDVFVARATVGTYRDVAASARARRVSRRFERSSSCSAATLRPRRPSRRSCLVSPARFRRGFHRSCWSGAPTSSPRSAASRSRSIVSARPRRPACRPSHSRPASAPSRATCSC